MNAGATGNLRRRENLTVNDLAVFDVEKNEVVTRPALVFGGARARLTRWSDDDALMFHPFAALLAFTVHFGWRVFIGGLGLWWTA